MLDSLCRIAVYHLCQPRMQLGVYPRMGGETFLVLHGKPPYQVTYLPNTSAKRRKSCKLITPIYRINGVYYTDKNEATAAVSKAIFG